MTKQITIYEPNAQGAIIKKVGTSYENAEVIDGEVVNEGFENADNLFSTFFSFFGSSRSTPKAAQKKRGEDTYNDNGREYNEESGNWEYTAEANGDANPFSMENNIVPNSDWGSELASDAGLTDGSNH